MAVYLCPACGNNLRKRGGVSQVIVHSTIPWWKYDSSSANLPAKYRCSYCSTFLKRTEGPPWVSTLAIISITAMIVLAAVTDFLFEAPCSEGNCFAAHYLRDEYDKLKFFQFGFLGISFLPVIVENLMSKRYVYTIF